MMATSKCRYIYFPKYFMAVRKFTNIYVPKYFCTSVDINGRFTYTYIIPRLPHISCATTTSKKATDRLNVAQLRRH